MATINIFPKWNTNPYLNMLLLEARARGWEITGGSRVADHLLKDLPKLVAGDILHVHWTGPFGEASPTLAEYRRLLNGFVDGVTKAKARGVQVLWTVHNLVAHDTKYYEEEIVLANALCDLSDRILVLNSETVEAAADQYDIPTEKVVHIPHASYVGIYPPPLMREEVRGKLGISDGFRTVGIVGAIRPYKGVGDFLEAARLVSQRVPRCAVVMAGETSASALSEVEAHMPHDMPVFRRHVRLSDSDITTWLSAIDVMVLPYRKILNSGSMMLAASFGVPVVLPRLKHLVDEFGDQPWISFFSDSEDEKERWQSIADAIEESFDDRASKSRAAMAFAQSYTLWDMTKAYADLVDGLAAVDEA